MMISSILIKMCEFASGMEEFNARKKAEDKSHAKANYFEACQHMWGVWNSWNAVIGSVLSHNDPEMLYAFNKIISEFWEQQIIPPLKKDGRN